MSFFDSLDIAATGLTAERLRMDVTAENLANAQTTRGPGGQPYRRQEVILEQAGGFGATLAGAMGAMGPGTASGSVAGVQVAGIVNDPTPDKLVYDPGNPDANAQAFTNGYFRTGDQGFLDAAGYLTLAGRIKELINRGGEKISPLEVDAVLLAHPAVAEAVSFAVPDAKYGEEVHGAVVLKGTATVEELLAFCRGRLADFKVPKRLHLAQALPRTATGKIQRRHVSAHFQQANQAT